MPPAEAIAAEIIRALAEGSGSLADVARKVMEEEETLLSVDDVLTRVPWSRRTVEKMIQHRQIPMVKVEGRWIITRKAFRKAAERGFPSPGIRSKDTRKSTK